MAAVFTSVVAADSIVSIVVAIRSVMDGDYLNALIHGAFAVVGIIGVARWYKVNFRVNYVGDKGKVSFWAKWRKKLTAEDIEFSDKFSLSDYKNQVSKRGWTTESIADAINNPVKVGESVNKYTGNSVTLYYVDDIHYVAVDDVTGKVIQVANLTESTWKMSGK